MSKEKYLRWRSGLRPRLTSNAKAVTQKRASAELSTAKSDKANKTDLDSFFTKNIQILIDTNMLFMV